MIKEIMIGLIPTIVAIVAPVLIRVLNKRVALIKNGLLRDLAIETLLEVDLFFAGKDKFDKFTHTAEITKNRLLNKTNGIDSILAKRIVKNKNYPEEIQNIFSNYKFENRMKQYEDFQYNGAVTENTDTDDSLYIEAATDFNNSNVLRAGFRKKL